MPRPSLGPRLYLDPSRRMWIIRDGSRFIRLALSEDEREDAENSLREYLGGGFTTVTDGYEHVYFLRAGDRLKIGRAKNVKARIDALQRMSPVKLTLLWAQRGGSVIESDYHRRFSAYRIHGEWFEIKGELAVFLSRYVGGIPHNLCRGTEIDKAEVA